MVMYVHIEAACSGAEGRLEGLQEIRKSSGSNEELGRALTAFKSKAEVESMAVAGVD